MLNGNSLNDVSFSYYPYAFSEAFSQYVSYFYVFAIFLYEVIIVYKVNKYLLNYFSKAKIIFGLCDPMLGHAV